MKEKKIINSGFTLLELLVVISIIGILLAVGAVAFSTAQKKSRDARRKQDIEALQSGYEQYYAENGQYGATCNVMEAESDIFPGSAPVDPKNNATYYYDCPTEGISSYCVCAQLETAVGNASDRDCSSWVSNGDYYCLPSLQ